MSLARRIELLGVVEDGSTRGPGVPADVRRAIRVGWQEPVVLAFRLVTAAGAPVDLTGLTLRFAVHLNSAWPALLAKEVAPTGSDLAQGLVEITLSKVELRELRPASYVYEVWLMRSAERTDLARVIPLSQFRIEPAATE